MQNYDKNTFCIMPFTSLSSDSLGFYRVCCESKGLQQEVAVDSIIKLWNSSFFKNLRLDLKNGIKNKNCNACWKNETTGHLSMRMTENMYFGQKKITEVLSEMHPDGHMPRYPQTLDFKFDNLCNLKCVTCNQLLSSTHQIEVHSFKKQKAKLPTFINVIDKNYKNTFRLNETNIRQIANNFKSVLTPSSRIRLSGGEPLINPFLPTFLEELPRDIYVEIITNGTSLKFYDLLKSFQNLRLNFSIDHVNPEKFNYIRFPAIYSEVFENFKRILKSKIELEISLTLSIFNIFDLEEILLEFEKWSAEKTILININHVVEPFYFSFQTFDLKTKQEIVIGIKSFISSHKNLKIFKHNPVLYSYLHNFENTIGEELENYQNIKQERLRVLELYDKTRSTNYNIFSNLTNDL